MTIACAVGGEQGMDEQTYLDYITALGAEFCEVLGPVVGEDAVVPHDGYEVFVQAFGEDGFGPDVLEALTEAQIEELRDVARAWLECPQIGDEHILETIRRVLLRWAPGSE